jgi:hypothetical protein
MPCLFLKPGLTATFLLGLSNPASEEGDELFINVQHFSNLLNSIIQIIISDTFDIWPYNNQDGIFVNQAGTCFSYQTNVLWHWQERLEKFLKIKVCG